MGLKDAQKAATRQIIDEVYPIPDPAVFVLGTENPAMSNGFETAVTTESPQVCPADHGGFELDGTAEMGSGGCQTCGCEDNSWHNDDLPPYDAGNIPPGP